MAGILEIIGDGFEVMILGLGTVFIALISLILVVDIINRLINPKKNKKKNLEEPQSALNVTDSHGKQGVSSENDQDSLDPDELIAVISAAVAASLNRSTHQVIVRSVRRVSAGSTIWNQTGRQEQIASRL